MASHWEAHQRGWGSCSEGRARLEFGEGREPREVTTECQQGTTEQCLKRWGCIDTWGEPGGNGVKSMSCLQSSELQSPLILQGLGALEAMGTEALALQGQLFCTGTARIHWGWGTAQVPTATIPLEKKAFLTCQAPQGLAPTGLTSQITT